ncbi:unnamed protein product [Prunus armeniaca]|uniref:Uncharacterized protein n=1 Tax=Prunus armeniaca TaxID=36596 RepID=A0A6J5U2U0_PRUAR|nr:unnamed protein product [Prunus armeniaca]CAB4300894.1 unnamed protein product [Prunus armeniaca]
MSVCMFEEPMQFGNFILKGCDLSSQCGTLLVPRKQMQSYICYRSSTVSIGKIGLFHCSLVRPPLSHLGIDSVIA